MVLRVLWGRFLAMRNLQKRRSFSVVKTKQVPAVNRPNIMCLYQKLCEFL